MEAMNEANDLVVKAFKLVYKDAKEKAPKLKNPMYGYFNKTKAAIYLGISRSTLDVWIKKVSNSLHDDRRYTTICKNRLR